jgi:hypothetical protein
LAACGGGTDDRINAEALIKSLRAKLPVGVLILHDKRWHPIANLQIGGFS